MPETVVAVPEARPEQEESEFPRFSCQQCKSKVEGEPRCDACKRCALCCDCKYCMTCEVRCKPCSSCVMCVEHCACWQCDACSRKHRVTQKKDENCGACVEQCACWVCGSCGVTFKRWRTRHVGSTPCPVCSGCTECCLKKVLDGGPRCRVIRFFNPMKPTFHTAIATALRMKNRSGRLLSSEIEVAGTLHGSNPYTAQAVAKWAGGIVHDGSLPEGGFEINTAPAGGDKFLDEIKEIGEGLKLDGAVTDRSCGAHLHIDARDFTPYDLRRLIYLYAHIERGIYELVARERRDNRYCVPCADRYVHALANGSYLPKDKKKPPSAGAKTKHSIIVGIYGHDPGMDLKDIRRDKYNSSRYNALNLHSWMYRGTVECRVLHGTVDPTEIQNWGMMWATIVDYAFRAKESQIKGLRGTHNQILDGVVGESRPDIVEWMVAQRKRFRGRTSPHPESPDIFRPDGELDEYPGDDDDSDDLAD